MKDQYDARMQSATGRQRFEKKQADMKAQVKGSSSSTRTTQATADQKEKSEIKQRLAHEKTLRGWTQKKKLTAERDRLNRLLSRVLRYQAYPRGSWRKPGSYDEVTNVIDHQHFALDATKADQNAPWPPRCASRNASGELSALQRGDRGRPVRQGQIHRMRRDLEERGSRGRSSETCRATLCGRRGKEPTVLSSDARDRERPRAVRGDAEPYRAEERAGIRKDQPLLAQVGESLDYIRTRMRILQSIKAGYPAWKRPSGRKIALGRDEAEREARLQAEREKIRRKKEKRAPRGRAGRSKDPNASGDAGGHRAAAGGGGRRDRRGRTAFVREDAFA